MPRIFIAAFLLITLPVCAQEVVSEPELMPRVHGPELAKIGLDPVAIAELDVMLQEHVAEGHLSGAVVMISCGGTVGYLEEFGRADIDADTPMKRDTLLRIFSMSKPIVAAAAMAIWEDGKFKLDDPISEYLPEWEGVKVNTPDGPVDADQPITVRHFMTHTAGISYDDIKGYGKAIWKAPLEELSGKLAARGLRFQPGSDYLYGYSIDVLGRYIEAVEGKELDEILRERLFDPLGMDDTEFWVRNEADVSRLARVYTKRDDRLAPAMGHEDLLEEPTSKLGGQALVSTTVDYAKFCAMLAGDGEFNGVRVLEASTVEKMFENNITSEKGEYGLGAWADGNGIYTWGGMAGTSFWVDRNTDCYVIYMVQKVGYKAPADWRFKELVGEAMGK